jgi:hypothetical protein
MVVGRIVHVPLRDVWKHEALDFTRWLQENIDLLNEMLDLNLVSAEGEQAAGNFSVDLVAEDDGGNPVVIENQLEKSDHDHLGKIITYMTAIGSKVAIWIVADARPEHIAAITWLNESAAASFYMIKVQAIKIADSPPAPLLTLIVGPTEEGRQVGEAKEDLAERQVLRLEFWRQLLEQAKGRTKLHAQVSPRMYSWIGAGSGRSGITYNYSIRQHDSTVELYIDKRKDNESENKKIFDFLYKNKTEIESVFGTSLEWLRMDSKRACSIRYVVSIGGYRDDQSEWPQIHDAMIDAMIRLNKAMKPFIEKLDLQKDMVG